MKDQTQNSRREFIKKNSLIGAGLAFGLGSTEKVFSNSFSNASTPAILGGTPAIISRGWPDWPIWKPESDEKILLEVMRSGIWSRNKFVSEFEKRWAELIGAKACLSVVNGTNALNTSLAQLEIGWGDEVLVPPYTFIASVSCIVFNGAVPVFVDIDPETFQIDPDKIEAKITPRTRAIIPVHLFGLPADMDRIMAIARKHKLLVVEDACQAWLAEINHKKVGTFGDAGCFSFQNSKNIPIGEAGAIVSDDEEFINRCFSFHNYGNPYGTEAGTFGAGTVRIGTKLRLTEYQAAIGLAQLKRLEEQTEIRNVNAAYLKSLIQEIPGIIPYKLYPNVTRAAFHIFPFRYQKDEFKGLSREKFFKAIKAEGVQFWHGYNQGINHMPFIKNAFNSKYFRKFYSESYLDYNRWVSENQCPANDKLSTEEAVWILHEVLLGTKQDYDNIAEAIAKVQKHAEEINKKI